jgi:hypothetical protein
VCANHGGDLRRCPRRENPARGAACISTASSDYSEGRPGASCSRFRSGALHRCPNPSRAAQPAHVLHALPNAA